MRQFHDVKRTRQTDQLELTTLPGPLVQSNIVQNSLSDNFEEAKQEWELLTHISNESSDFVGNCELCNHVNHKENWLIGNIHTQKRLKVGSDCIKRFIKFNGMKSQQDSNTFFEIKQKEIKTEQSLLVLYNHVIMDILPFKREGNKFRKTLLELLEARGQLKLLETFEGVRSILKSVFRKDNPSPKEVNNLSTLMNSPSEYPMQSENRAFKNYAVKEGQTWRKKGKVTASTLVRSSVYRDPSNKFK